MKRNKENKSNTSQESHQNSKEIVVKPKKKKRPFWITTTIAAELGREELLAATFKEIILHLMSLIFLSIYIFNQTNDSEYYLAESLKKAFDAEGGLAEVVTAEKFWEYVDGVVLEQFYGADKVEELQKTREELKNENNTNNGTKESEPFILSSVESLVVLNENFVLGVPRIRQVKVRDDSCEIHGYFRRLFLHCYNAFSTSTEDTESFGLAEPPAWTYSDSSITRSVSYWGTLTSYSGGGFFVDFSTELPETMDMLDKLRDNFWITRGTRAVFIDFSIYNVNLNLYCISKLVFEFLPPGGVTPGFRFTPANLTPFPTGWQWTLRVLLYCFCAYALFCLFEEIREMVHFKGGYFLHFWNYIDISVILLTCLIMVGTEYMRAVMGSYIQATLESPTSYGNLETARVIYQVVKISGAVLLFILFLRTFKYLNFNRRMSQLNNTIKKCTKDILGFSVMFFVAYFAYAELGYLVFGSHTDDFRSFGKSMFTLLRTILGDFDYEKIHNANWVVAPIYFLTYIILVFFILLNMFLAIINDTYADVKIDIAIAPKEIEMSEYLMEKYRKFLKRLGCKVKKEKEKQTILNTNIAHIRDALVKLDFDDREIEMYFTRYDIDPLKDLKSEDIERFFDKFAQEELARKKGEEFIVTWKEFQRQDDKLVELENALVMVGQKVTDLMRLIENIQGETQNKALQL